MNQVIPDWTGDMDNIFDGGTLEYELDARKIVKSMAAYIENPENRINMKNISPENFDAMNKFLVKLCDIGNLMMPRNNEDRYLLFSHAIFIADNGWEVFKNMMIDRKRKKK